MPQLTSEEINTLLEAVEMWKEMVQVEGHELAAMMGGMISGDQEKIKDAVPKAHEEAKRKHRSRKEEGILLQAKLIQMRDSMDIGEATEFMKKGGE